MSGPAFNLPILHITDVGDVMSCLKMLEICSKQTLQGPLDVSSFRAAVESPWSIQSWTHRAPLTMGHPRPCSYSHRRQDWLSVGVFDHISKLS